MDIVNLISLFIVFSFTVLLMFRKNRKNPPPRKSGYPFLGSTFQVEVTNLHLTLTEWAEIYGDIYEVNVFGTMVVVLNSPELMREAFLKEPNATLFSDRVHNSLTFELFHEAKDIAFGINSESQIKRRTLGNKILKSSGVGMVESENSVRNELNQTISSLRSYKNCSFDPDVVVTNFINQLIFILLTGRRQNDPNSNLIQAMSTYNRRLNEILNPNVSLLMNCLPFMRYIPSKVSKLYFETKQSQLYFEEELRKEQKHGLSRGMLHVLYEELEHTQKTNLSADWLTEKSIFAIITNIVAAGILTSRATLLTAIRVLLEHKDIQRKLQSEVDKTVGSERLPTFVDRRHMPYTEAFLFEVMRYGSNLPIVVRSLKSDTRLKCYDLMKNSIVIANLWKIHHDESLYPDPYEFKPERFLDRNGNIMQPNTTERQSLLSFGIGKRSCIGRSFATNRLFLFIATLMQNFTIEPEADNLEKFDPRDMQTTMIRVPHSYRCRVVNRRDI